MIEEYKLLSVATKLPFPEPPRMFHELLLTSITGYDRDEEVQLNSGVYQHQIAQGHSEHEVTSRYL